MADLDKMIAIVTNHYAQWEQNPAGMNNGCDYEYTFARTAQAMKKNVSSLIGKNAKK